jgi:hypothetical protein
MADPHHPDTPRNRGDHDAAYVSPISPAEDARTIMLNKVSWGAILAGVVVALVTQLILNLLGIGIGAAILGRPSVCQAAIRPWLISRRRLLMRVNTSRAM